MNGTVRRPRSLTRGVACILAGAILAAGAGVASAETLIVRNSAWKWFAGPAAPAPDWDNPGYPDGAWSTGNGAFGYGEPHVATTIPYGGDRFNKWRTTYFRREFVVPGDPSQYSSLFLEADYDDGFVVYVNGVEVGRRSMPSGAVTYSTFAIDHESSGYESIPLSGGIALLNSGTNLIAVELHQQSAGSSDLVFDAGLILTESVSITRGPYVQMGCPDAMTVRWRTDVPSPSRVSHGPAPDQLTTIVDDPALVTDHEVRLTGLTADTEYFYSVGDPTGPLAGGDANHRFRTNPPVGPPRPVRIWAIGDFGWGSASQAQVRDAYLSYTGVRGTDLWLMLGDNAYTVGSDAEYQAGLFNMYPSLLRTSVAWPTRGNHDLLYAGPGNDYYDHFTMPTQAEAGGVVSGTEAYYSIDYANIHFVCLDSEGTSLVPSSAMFTWLRSDVAATTQDWIVCFWHHPPYTKGSHDSDQDNDSNGKMGDMRRNALPILDSLGVDLVLTGHSHSYERSFLLRSHYDVSSTLAPAMIVDGGNGRPGSDGAYLKPSLSTGPFEGSVYVVAGSSGITSGGSLDHPVMVESFNILGSLVLDVDGARLDARFLTNTGAMLDSFTIAKGPSIVDAPQSHAMAPRLSLRLDGPNPSEGPVRFSFEMPRAQRARLDIVDAAGRRIATVARGAFEAGAHSALWNGRDARGRDVATGVYFAVLESGTERRVVRVIRTR